MYSLVLYKRLTFLHLFYLDLKVIIVKVNRYDMIYYHAVQTKCLKTSPVGLYPYFRMLNAAESVPMLAHDLPNSYVVCYKSYRISDDFTTVYHL